MNNSVAFHGRATRGTALPREAWYGEAAEGAARFGVAKLCTAARGAVRRCKAW